MAAPITHIVLTEKIFDKFFKERTKKDFFVGTLFPDIRYLKVIDRDKTHYNGLTISDMEDDNSFLAGVKFHSILDIAREKFIIANDVYSLCPKSKYIVESLKLLEDEFFYPYIQDYNIYIDYLNDILSTERNYGIAEKDLKRWHSLLRQYFQEQPNQKTVTDFYFGIDFNREIIDEINNNIAIMRRDERIIDIIKNLYKNFDFPGSDPGV